MANAFLREIDKVQRRARIDRIYDFRIAQTEHKAFKETMARFHKAERMAEAKEQGETGRKPQGAPMTEKEMVALEAQQHVKFTSLSPEEQQARESMWETIPAHLRDKARKLAGG